MNEIAFYCLLIGKPLLAVSLAVFICCYMWISFDLMTKQQDAFSRQHKKYLARQKQKATNQLISDRATEMVKSIVVTIGTNTAVDLAMLRKACKYELKRYARESERLHKDEKLST
jgi:hypothetical protein